MKFLKFTGPFRELKRFGFKHRYLYARNYRCWITFNPEDIYSDSRDLSVWMKGKDISTPLNNYSYLLFPFISGEEEIPFPPFEGKRYFLCVDMQENRMIKGTSFFEIMREKGIKNTEELSEEEHGKHLDSYYERYLNVSLSVKALETLQDFYKLGWLELGETTAP